MLYGYLQQSQSRLLLIFKDLDTIYALQDRVDDAKLGIGSSALATSRNTYLFLSLCAATFVICLTVVGILNQQGPTFFVVSIGGTSLELCSQLLVLNVDEPRTYAGKNNCVNFIAGRLTKIQTSYDVIRDWAISSAQGYLGIIWQQDIPRALNFNPRVRCL